MTYKTDYSYVLKWWAAPRPPAHTKKMLGQRRFNRYSEALKFWNNQADDKELISICKVTKTEEYFEDENFKFK